MSYEFFDLPYRLIIFSILPYHLERVNTFDIREKDVAFFGYFKKDITRTVFFLFPSLSIQGDIHKRVCIGISNLHHLTLEQFSVQELTIISRNSHRLIKLNSVSFHMWYFLSTLGSNPTQEEFNRCQGSLGKLFSHEHGFPSLKHLAFFFNSDGEDGEKGLVDMNTWHKSEKMWKNIESLQITIGEFRQRDIPLFSPDHSSILSNVKKIDLESIHLNTETKLDLPNVIFVTLEDIKNLVIIPTLNKVTILEATHLDPKIVKPIFELSHSSLEELEIVHSDLNVEDFTNNCYNYLFSRDSNCRIQNFKSLKRLRFTSIYWDPEEVTFSLPLPSSPTSGDNIESLFFCSCPHLDEGDLFPISTTSSKFSSLQELALWSIPNFGCNLENTSLPFSKTLQKLSLHSCNQVSDALFKNYEWLSLEDLSVSRLPLIQGDSWSSLPSLRIFQISECTSFNIDDHFFNTHTELSKLECLLITNMSCRGVSWCEEVGKSMRKIEMNFCDNFTDDFFRNVSLPNLQILTLQACPKVTGQKWKSDCKESVEIIILDSSELFGNDFFSEQLVFPKLRRIEFSGELGKGLGRQKWHTGEIKMPELESLEAFRCNKVLGDEIFQSKSVVEGVEYIHIHDCDMFRCENWAYLGNLRKIRMRKINVCAEFWNNKPYNARKVVEEIEIEM